MSWKSGDESVSKKENDYIVRCRFITGFDLYCVSVSVNSARQRVQRHLDDTRVYLLKISMLALW